MSCIRFNTPAQRAQMARLAPSMLTPEEVAAQHPAPPVTDSKIRRLRVLATSADPMIRASVASSYHLPEDLAETLAHDPAVEVRNWLARNETVACDILRELAHDDAESVRAFVAVNYFAPADAMAELADDDSETVRRLVGWKAGLATA
jgi:hypothetical protein